MDAPPEDAEEPREAPDVRLTALVIGSASEVLPTAVPLPATMALATGLTTLADGGTSIDWAHAQSQAVLRSLRLRSLAVPSVIRTGQILPPTSGDCHGGGGPWQPPASSPGAVQRACQRLAAVASAPLNSSPLSRSLEGLQVETFTTEPALPFLYGMRPPQQQLHGIVRSVRAAVARSESHGQEGDSLDEDEDEEDRYDHNGDGEAEEDEEDEEDDVSLAAELHGAASRTARALNLTAEEQEFVGRPFLGLLGLFPELRLQLGLPRNLRDEASLQLGLDRFWQEEAARHRPAPAATALVKTLPLHLLWPEELRWVCEFPHLLSLAVRAAAAGLPPCLARLTSLVELDVRGSAFGVLQPYADAPPPSSAPGSPRQRLPVPLELASLEELRLFVAFQQSTVQCGPKSCRPILEELETPPAHAIGIKIGGGWLCPQGGAWSVRLDDRSQAWWGWHKLEKFWVDGNNFTGPIPATIAEDWPNMVTLDLYSNDITGSIPPEIRQLKRLLQLQLQHNNLSGGPSHPDDGFPFFTQALQPDAQQIDLRLNPGLIGTAWVSNKSVTNAWNGLGPKMRSPAVFVGGTGIAVDHAT